MRMSWAAARETTRKEDEAYSLLGLFEINMPLLYGEGHNAFIRLQKEIISHSDDMTILCWHDRGRSVWPRKRYYSSGRELHEGILAPDPECFSTSSTVDTAPIHYRSLSAPFEMTNRGLRIEVPLVQLGNGLVLAILDCTDHRDFGPWVKVPPSLTSRESLPKVGIFLNRIDTGGNHFCRVFNDRISWLDNIKGIPETIFIRRGTLYDKPKDPKCKLSEIRICGDESMRREWQLLGLWQRDPLAKWRRTSRLAFSNLPLRAESLHGLESMGWNEGRTDRFSVEKPFQAIGIVLERIWSTRRLAIVFYRGGHPGSAQWTDDKQLQVKAVSLDRGSDNRNGPNLRIRVAEFEASARQKSMMWWRRGAARTLSKDISFCCTIQLCPMTRRFGDWEKNERCHDPRTLGYDDDQLGMIFENRLQSGEGCKVAPWAGKNDSILEPREISQ